MHSRPTPELNVEHLTRPRPLAQAMELDTEIILAVKRKGVDAALMERIRSLKQGTSGYDKNSETARISTIENRKELVCRPEDCDQRASSAPSLLHTPAPTSLFHLPLFPSERSYDALSTLLSTTTSRSNSLDLDSARYICDLLSGGKQLDMRIWAIVCRYLRRWMNRLGNDGHVSSMEGDMDELAVTLAKLARDREADSWAIRKISRPKQNICAPNEPKNSPPEPKRRAILPSKDSMSSTPHIPLAFLLNIRDSLSDKENAPPHPSLHGITTQADPRGRSSSIHNPLAVLPSDRDSLSDKENEPPRASALGIARRPNPRDRRPPTPYRRPLRPVLQPTAESLGRHSLAPSTPPPVKPLIPKTRSRSARLVSCALSSASLAIDRAPLSHPMSLKRPAAPRHDPCAFPLEEDNHSVRPNPRQPLADITPLFLTSILPRPLAATPSSHKVFSDQSESEDILSFLSPSHPRVDLKVSEKAANEVEALRANSVAGARFVGLELQRSLWEKQRKTREDPKQKENARSRSGQGVQPAEPITGENAWRE